MKKKIILLSFIFIIIIIGLIYVVVQNQVFYYDYTFIDHDRFNLCSFKYPKDWTVKMKPYFLADENSEGSTSEEVIVYLDNTDNNYIAIGLYNSKGIFKMCSEDKYEQHDLKINNNVIAKTFRYPNNQVAQGKIREITFYGDKWGEYGKSFAEVHMDEKVYMKNKKEIIRLLKSVKFNRY